MGEWVKASQIRIGDYVSSLGPGFQDRRVLDIKGIHQRSKVNDGPWRDVRYLSICCGNARNPQMGESITAGPDHLVWRTVRRPVVDIRDDDTVYVNGLYAGKIILVPNETAHEYMKEDVRRQSKGEPGIIGGPSGYVWRRIGPDGELCGQATSYEECLDRLVYQAAKE